MTNLKKMRSINKKLPIITFENLVLKKLGLYLLEGLDTPILLNAINSNIHENIERYLQKT